MNTQKEVNGDVRNIKEGRKGGEFFYGIQVKL